MRKKHETRRAIAALIAFFTLLTFACAAFAEGGNGDGTGGGKDKPLALETSSVINGAQNVGLSPEIVLNFNKNVVHFTVRENNMKCFTMTDGSGKSVPVEVIMGDDQVDPSIKRIVTVKPKSALEPGTVYMLKISKSLTSKSGVSLGKDTYISFTTEAKTTTTTTKASTTAAKPTPSSSKPAVTVIQGTPVPAATASSAVTRASTSASVSQTIQLSTSRAARTSTTRPERTPGRNRETVTASTTAAKTTAAVKTTAAKTTAAVKTTAAIKTTSAKTVSNRVTEAVTVSQTVTLPETIVTAAADTSAALTQDEYFSSEETTTETLSSSEENSEGEAEETAADSAEESGNVRAYLPYIISGAIAIFAIPAIVIIIKKKKI